MRRLLTALPALALLAGCGLLYAEVEVPSITMTLPDQVFPATTVPGAALVKELDYDLGDKLSVLTDQGVTVELRLLSMRVDLVAAPSMGDFGDLESVTLSVLPPPTQTLPEAAVIAAYARSPSNPHPTTISVVGLSSLDLFPYLDAGAIRLRFEAVSSTLGIIPDWTGDLSVEFYLVVNVDLGKQLSKI
jgi:hypothetical protein